MKEKTLITRASIEERNSHETTEREKDGESEGEKSKTQTISDRKGKNL